LRALGRIETVHTMAGRTELVNTPMNFVGVTTVIAKLKKEYVII